MKKENFPGTLVLTEDNFKKEVSTFTCEEHGDTNLRVEVNLETLEYVCCVCSFEWHAEKGLKREKTKFMDPSKVVQMCSKFGQD